MPLITNLYHYTSFEAFLGIFNNRTIWASSLNLLNDEKEYKYTIELLQPHLEKLLQKHKNKKLLELLIRLIINSEGGPTFITSFSERPDSLSQWHAYCRNGGCSIGFDNDSLIKIAKRSELKLIKCNYNIQEQNILVSEFIDDLSKNIAYQESSIKDKKEGLKFHADYVYNQINLLANKIKHPAFEEEQEWRYVKEFVNANHPKLKYRVGAGMLVPYFEIDLIDPNKTNKNLPPITEIFVAPHKNIKMSVKTLRTFLAGERANSNNSPFIYVKESEAPYREI